MEEYTVKLNKADLMDLIRALDKLIPHEMALGHMGKVEDLDSMQTAFKSIVEGKNYEIS